MKLSTLALLLTISISSFGRSIVKYEQRSVYTQTRTENNVYVKLLAGGSGCTEGVSVTGVSLENDGAYKIDAVVRAPLNNCVFNRDYKEVSSIYVKLPVIPGVTQEIRFSSRFFGALIVSDNRGEEFTEISEQYEPTLEDEIQEFEDLHCGFDPETLEPGVCTE